MFKKIYILLIFAHCLSWADSKPILNASDDSLLIEHFKSRYFTSLTNERIRSLIVRIAAKQQLYHLVLQDRPDSKLLKKLYKLKLNYKKKKTYLLTASIINAQTGQIVRRVRRKKITVQNLFKNTEIALELLFSLKEKKKTLLENKNASRKKQLLLENAADKRVLIDFKKRIKGIKNNISDEFVKQSEDQEANKKKKEQDLIDGNNEDLKKKNNSQNLVSADDKTARWITKYFIGLGLEYQYHNVFDRKGEILEVLIGSQYNFLTVGGGLEIANKDWDNYKAKLSLNYFQPIGNRDEPSSVSSFEIDTEISYEINDKYNISFLLNRDVMMFGARPQIGQGIELAVYNFWKAGVGFSYYYKTDRIFANYQTPIAVSYGNENTLSGVISAYTFKVGYEHDSSWLLKKTKLVLSFKKDQVIINGLYQNTVDTNNITLQGFMSF